MTSSSYSALATAVTNAHKMSLEGLFAEDASRPEHFSFEAAGLFFDFSKLHVTPAVLDAGVALASDMDFDAARRALFSGAIVNTTENRPAIHAALRGAGDSLLTDTALAEEVKAAGAALKAFAAAFAAGEIKTPDGDAYTSLIHLGIGGSALGPEMLVEVFGSLGLPKAIDAHVVSNIDASALVPVLDRCDPERTLVVLASKSFSTVETLTNAATVEAWMAGAGVEQIRARMVAVTAAPQKARDFGLPDAQILAFPESVGGRYSVWSAVSVPAVLAYGYDAFAAFLDGAAAMDTHFKDAAPSGNIPFMAALMDLAYANALKADSRATFAYDDRLALLPAYLQQLETESNGKHVTASGAPLDLISSPVVWGGVGTDAQHAVFQLLHQGSHLVPTEFIAASKPGHPHGNHHQLLLSNCLAQSAALMRGRSVEQAAELLGTTPSDPVAIAKSFPGNRPSTTILMDRLTPSALGALLAFYEHRVFALGVLLGINPYDQMGVELGKEMAKGLEAYLAPNPPAPSQALDASTRALLKKIQGAA
ncbi:MAG: glucose-6-phosphate isomerase [Pseudomonadota bacterium]